MIKMPARKRLSFKEKSNILEESLKPNFAKEKICKKWHRKKTQFYQLILRRAMPAQRNVVMISSPLKFSKKHT